MGKKKGQVRAVVLRVELIPFMEAGPAAYAYRVYYRLLRRRAPPSEVWRCWADDALHAYTQMQEKLRAKGFKV